MRIVCSLALAVALAGCSAAGGDRGSEGSATPVPLRSQTTPPKKGTPVAGVEYAIAKRVLDRHRDELMRKKGVVGAGITAIDRRDTAGTSNWGIIVYVRSLSGVDIPESLEEVPLKKHLSGVIGLRPGGQGLP
jgi:uncharacterized protein YceK